MRRALGVFLFLFAMYLLTYSGQVHTVDEAYMMAATESLYKGRLDVNQVAARQWDISDPGNRLAISGPDGNFYGRKGVAISLLALPLFGTGAALPGVGAVHLAHLTNAILTALTAALLLAYLEWLGFSRADSLVGALLFGLGTLAWPYARLFYGESVSALGVLVALVGVSHFRRSPSFRAAFVCGLGAGVGVAARQESAILLPVFLGGVAASAAVQGGRRAWQQSIAGMMAGGAGPAAAVALYNLGRFGALFDTGYRLSMQDFTYPLAQGLFKLLLSPAQGLLFYAPVMLLALPGMVALWRRGKHRLECLLVLASVSVYLLFLAKSIRGAGWAWGPRFLLTPLPLMMLPTAAGWAALRRRRGRALLWALAALSIGVQVVGVSVDFISTEVSLRLRYDFQDDFITQTTYLDEQERLLSFAQSPLFAQIGHIGQEPFDWGWAAPGGVDGVALGAALVGLGAGAAALWTAYRRRAQANAGRRMGSFVCVIVLCAPVIAGRATMRPFYGAEADGRSEALTHVEAAQTPGDAMISVVPYLYEYIMDRFPRLPPVYGLPRDQRVDELSRPLLMQAASNHARLWFLSVWTRPADPANHTERWLTAHAFPAQSWEFGGYRLALFGTPAVPFWEGAPRVNYADAIRLEHVTAAWQGHMLQLRFRWRTLSAVDADYQIFVQVYDADGQRVAQADHSPVGGFAPVSTWLPGDVVEDRVGVVLPGDAAAVYRIAVGWYDWVTGARLPAAGPEGEPLSDDIAWLVVAP